MLCFFLVFSLCVYICSHVFLIDQCNVVNTLWVLCCAEVQIPNGLMWDAHDGPGSAGMKVDPLETIVFKVEFTDDQLLTKGLKSFKHQKV